MKENKHKGSLGAKFEHFGATPSSGLWDSIADSLDGKKKRKTFVWWWAGSGIAAVGLIAFILYNVNSTVDYPNQISRSTKGEIQYTHIQTFFENNHFDTIINKEVQGINTQENIVQSNQTNQSESHDETMVINTDSKKEFRTNTSVSGEKTEKQTDSFVDFNDIKKKNTILKEEDNNIAENILSTSTELKFIQKLPLIPISKLNEPLSAFHIQPITNKKSRMGNWEIGLGLSHWNSIQFAHKKEDELKNPFPSDDTSFVGIGLLPEKIIPINSYAIPKRPIAFKIHIAKRFTPRFRLSTGVLWECTSFEIKKKNTFESSYSYLSSERINSIGIPIGVEYDFVNRKRFQIGFGVQVLNEIAFLKKQKKESNTLDNSKSSTLISISDYHLGFNLNLNASYNLSERLRFQVNPGIRYYAIYNSNGANEVPVRKLWHGGSAQLIWEL